MARQPTAQTTVAFWSLIGFLVLVALELLLRLLSFAVPQVQAVLDPDGRTVPDSVLGWRPSPAFPGHDAWGFRNSEVPDVADVLILGDSQAYGRGVSRAAALPAQFQRVTGLETYSMAYGGYAAPHYRVLAEEGLELMPSTIVLVLYLGNDLFDSFSIVYGNDYFADLRSKDPDVRARIDSLAGGSSISEMSTKLAAAPASVLFERPSGPLHHLLLAGVYGRARWAFAKWREGGFEEVDNRFERAAERAYANPHSVVVDSPAFKTILTPAYRLLALNLGDARIEEGLRLTLLFIKEIDSLATEAAADLLVLAVPTKEYVVARVLDRDLWPKGGAFGELVDNERKVLDYVATDLRVNEIEFLDATLVLVESALHDAQPYFTTEDGHLSEAGHLAVAELVATRIR